MNRTPVVQGRIIDQQPSLKSFALADILSLTTGLRLSSPGAQAALVGYVTSANDAAAHAKDAKACLEEQLPFLKTIDLTLLLAAFRRDEDHVGLWLDVQARRYGAEHHVMPLSRWARRRNSHKL